MLQNLEPDDFIKKARQIEVKKRKRTIIITAIIMLLSISYLLYTVLTVSNTSNEINKVENINKALSNHIAQKDSILTVINNSLSKQDSLTSIIKTYFKLRNEHKADSLEAFYSDTVKSYFKNLKNIPRQLITKSDKQYWKKYETDNFLIIEPIQIVLNYNDFKAIVKGKQCTNRNLCFDELIELHFDMNKKLTFIRAYYNSN